GKIFNMCKDFFHCIVECERRFVPGLVGATAKKIDSRNVVAEVELMIGRLKIAQYGLVGHLIKDSRVALDTLSANAVVNRIARLCDIQSDEGLAVRPVCTVSNDLEYRLESFGIATDEHVLKMAGTCQTCKVLPPAFVLFQSRPILMTFPDTARREQVRCRETCECLPVHRPSLPQIQNQTPGRGRATARLLRHRPSRDEAITEQPQ